MNQDIAIGHAWLLATVLAFSTGHYIAGAFCVLMAIMMVKN